MCCVNLSTAVSSVLPASAAMVIVMCVNADADVSAGPGARLGFFEDHRP